MVRNAPIELEIQNLSSDPSSQDTNRITKGTDGKAITLALAKTVKSTEPATSIGSDVKVKSVELIGYSANLVTIQNKKYATLNLKSTVKIVFSASAEGAVTEVKVQSATKTGQPTLQYTGSSDPKVYSTRPDVTVNPKKTDRTTDSVEISLTVDEITLTSTQPNITQVVVTIPVKITATPPVPIDSIQLILPAKKSDGSTTTGNVNLTIDDPSVTDDSGTNKTPNINVTVTAGNAGSSGTNATVNEVDGKGFYPNAKGYCFYSVRDSAADKKDIWANIGGKCEYVACYKGSTSDGKTQALLCLYFRSGGSPERKYFGTDNAGTSNTEWKTISNEDDFIGHLKTLASSGSLTLNGQNTAQYNREYSNILTHSINNTMDHYGISRVRSSSMLYSFTSIHHFTGIEPERFSEYLALVGDASDNIPGVMGIGPKTAPKLIAKYGTFEEIIRSEEIKKLNSKGGKYSESIRMAYDFHNIVRLKRNLHVIDSTSELVKGRTLLSQFQNFLRMFSLQRAATKWTNVTETRSF